MRTFAGQSTAGLWGGTQESTFYDIPQTPYCRNDALRIVMPGIDEDPARLDTDNPDDTISLTEAIVTALKEHKQLRHLEVLVWPDDDGGLQITVSAVEPRKRADKVGVKTADPANWVEPVSTQLRKAIPSTAGLEAGRVDFASLGLTPVRAAGLLLEDHRRIPSIEEVEEDLLLELLEPYCDNGVPFLYQVIVSQGTSKTPFTMNTRLAVFDPEYHIRYDRDLRDQVKEGNPYDPAHIFKHANLTSTWQIPARDFFRVGSRRLLPHVSNYRRYSDTAAARRHLVGHEEYASLLRGSADSDLLLKDKVKMNPRIPVSADHLEHVLEIPPLYPVEGCWDRSPGRAPPVFETDRILRSATGTDQAQGADTTPAIPLDKAAMTPHGSDQHQYAAALVEQILTEEGATVRTGEGCDLLIDFDGLTWNGEIEIDNETSQFLVNALRALHQRRPLFVVAKDIRGARRCLEALLQPWKETTEHGVVLYNHDPVELTDGRVPLLPGDTASKWFLRPDGTLTLRDDEDAVITSGHGGDAVATFTFDTYHLVTTDTAYIVEDANGTEVSRYATKAEFGADWTRVATPIVPPHPELVTRFTDLVIRYVKRDRLPVPDLSRDWDVHHEIRRARSKIIGGSETEFERRYLVERDSDDLPEVRYDDYFERYLDWFTTLCDHDEPAKTVWGKEAPATKRRDEGDGQVRFLAEHTWAIPSGLTPPDLPFRDDGE